MIPYSGNNLDLIPQNFITSSEVPILLSAPIRAFFRSWTKLSTVGHHVIYIRVNPWMRHVIAVVSEVWNLLRYMPPRRGPKSTVMC